MSGADWAVGIIVLCVLTALVIVIAGLLDLGFPKKVAQR